MLYICFTNSYMHFAPKFRGNKVNVERGIGYSGGGLFSKVDIAEFEEPDGIVNLEKQQPVKAMTHGYEGDFKVGDIVKVKKSIRFWQVKQYSKDGFDCLGFVGRVQNLVLYGKKGTLCSAITPIKVEFLPENEGIPVGMFAKKFVGHFCAEELELIKAAPIERDPQQSAEEKKHEPTIE